MGLQPNLVRVDDHGLELEGAQVPSHEERDSSGLDSDLGPNRQRKAFLHGVQSVERRRYLAGPDDATGVVLNLERAALAVNIQTNGVSCHWAVLPCCVGRFERPRGLPASLIHRGCGWTARLH